MPRSRKPSLGVAGPAVYGEGVQREAAQRTLSRVRNDPSMQPQTAPAQPGSTPMPGGAPAGPLVDLDAPSERQWEPVTAGIPSGPGPGPEALGIPTLTPLDKLKRMYRTNPNPDLLELIMLAEGG